MHCHLAIVVRLIYRRREISVWVVSPRRTESTICSFSPGLQMALRPTEGSSPTLANLC